MVPPDAARVWTLAAEELAQVFEARDAEALTLSEAARESGYSADHLGSLIRQQTIPNAGRSGAPRIRRADSPQRNAERPGRPRNITKTNVMKLR